MTYLKLMNSEKKHLAVRDQTHDYLTTLCGCTITRPRSWTAITALEGDECERCASLAFQHPLSMVEQRDSV
jgi:hypothetical protein